MSKKLPYIQFYPGDWLKDPALTLCSPETRGVWIDFICAMHELNHCGVIAGTREQLARLGRCPLVQLDHALIELSSTKTADITERNGIITVVNRRMKKEYKELESNRLRQEKFQRNKKGNADITAESQTRARVSSSYSSSIKEKDSEESKRKLQHYPSGIIPYPETPEAVIAEAERQGYPMERETALKFISDYSSTGWIFKGQKITDWRRRIPVWRSNQYNNLKKGTGTNASYKHIINDPAAFDKGDDGSGF